MKKKKIKGPYPVFQPKPVIKERQSAEEQLKENCDLSDWNRLEEQLKDSLWTNNVVEYMKLFAEQYHKEQLREELRDELILFCCDCNVKLPEDKDYIDLVDNYLKDK